MGQKFSALPSATDFVRVNPFEKHRDDLDQHKLNNTFLGHTMFWSHCDLIPTQNIYRTNQHEYKNLKLMFLEMIFFFIMLLCLTTFATNGQYVEFESREQQTAFWKVCKKVRGARLPDCSLGQDTEAGWYSYMKNTFTPIVFNGKETLPPLVDQDFLYDLDENSVEWAPRYLGDTRTTVLLGQVRFRQVRVLPNRGCTIPENMTDVHRRCYSQFQDDRQSRKFYAKRRIPGDILPCYVWQEQNRTEMQPISGLMGTYPGDGFLFDLPLNRTQLQQMLRDMEEWEWIDVQTRAIVGEVTVFNPNVNLIIVNRFLFEFAPTGQMKPHHDVFVLPTRYLTMTPGGRDSMFFFLQVLTSMCFLCFFVYHLVLLRKAPYQYVKYTWNLMDLVIIALYNVYGVHRYRILTLFSQDNNLQPEISGLPLVYMPYAQLEESFRSAQAVFAWICLLSWIRVLKYLSLAQTFRVLIRTIEAACFQLAIFSFLYVSVTIGFAIAYVIGFGAADTTDGIYSTFGGCFFMLFFMMIGGVNLEPLLGNSSVSFMSNWVLRYLLFCSYMVLIALLLFNFFMAIVVDVYSRMVIQMSDFSPDAHRKKNPCMVFLYTYWYKWRGVQLVKEDEADVGSPDEQHLEVVHLPGFLNDVWQQKQHALAEMIREAEAKMGDDRAGGESRQGLLSKLSSKATGKDPPSAKKSKDLPKVNPNFISRLQLQRLLDDSPDLQAVLGAKRAIDVVRRFRTARGPDPYTEIARMQESVIMKLDALEKVGLNLQFKEVESLQMVSNGLNDALTEVESQWRTELTTLLESCSSISSHLIDLTDRLAACTEKHNEIARDINVESPI
jgi:hypothetical protein